MRQTAIALVVMTAACGTAAAQTPLEAAFAERAKDFGTVPHGPTLTHYFRFKNPTNQPLRITAIRVSCGCTTGIAPNPVVPPGGSSHIIAKMDTRRFTGEKSVTVYVTFAEPYNREVALKVRAFSRTDFQIHPEEITFGRLTVGKGGTAETAVALYGSPNWALTSIRTETRFLKAKAVRTAAVDGGVRYKVTAEVSPELPVGKWFTDVWLTTNWPQVPRIRIPVSVEVTPAVTALPARVKWPTAKVGRKLTKRVLLRADEPFRVLKVDGLTDGWEVDGTGGDAKPVHVLTITVTPAAPGRLDRTLTVVTDRDGQPNVPLSVSGEAVATASR